VDKHDFIDVRSLNLSVQDGVATLIARINRAINNARKERRGRKRSARPVLDSKLTAIFDRFYEGDKQTRQESLKSFIEAVFKIVQD
ncbi:MAG: hypothetical protein ABIU05_16860, partial [Nitrospirales bacterium]